MRLEPPERYFLTPQSSAVGQNDLWDGKVIGVADDVGDPGVSNAQGLPELACRHQVVGYRACLLDSLLHSKE